ncbi:carboxypeptidase-like regulatory domain-containing protein [uncultured Flavonifractor sp.]|uniref:Carboxypeptidase-like regulatory domain-containing protein n=1 Tax=Candidatus Flavonifractor intestinigallinarum TaxID=2838586 RepID=A0A9D2MKJ4_9FIRM|nr:carboxypeptidase-like regulatory domain-containing protein [uncultured Flavonifractor sp.]HJB79852.1 carboxypeptidase-like regulatory domain-containing protein [Candidatus Flavonifractor intestinigallinarum]
MADIKQDLLGLEYSASFTLQGIQEADINLELPPVSGGSATVYGTVTDGTDPLADATVKLFDSTGAPFQHTLTDASGQYSMSGIPAGTYTIAAVKDGYRLSGALGVTLAASDTTQMNLTCTADATLTLGAIAGTITTLVGTGLTPMAGAKITLKDSNGAVVASTYSADDGEFLFYDVADGLYTMLASAEGYLTSAPMAVTITGGSIANVTMSLTVDTRTYNGTVSGVIRDQKGTAVAGCFVGLYQITGTGAGATETLIATTKTNAEGKYLFGGVVGGQYLVKAKLEQ